MSKLTRRYSIGHNIVRRYIVPQYSVLDCVTFTQNELPDELFKATLAQLISEQLSHAYSLR